MYFPTKLAAAQAKSHHDFDMDTQPDLHNKP